MEKQPKKTHKRIKQEKQNSTERKTPSLNKAQQSRSKQRSLEKRKQARTKQTSRKAGTNRKKKRGKGKKNLVIELGISIVVFLLIVWGISSVTFTIVKIDGYAMSPTLNDQDRIFVSKLTKIKRFSLVYLRTSSDAEPVARRVVGLPGEQLEYREGQLYINGEAVQERFLSTIKENGELGEMEDFRLTDIAPVSAIPEGQYVVLGDNRLYATDSRYFGLVKEDMIIGSVKARIFPLHSSRQF